MSSSTAVLPRVHKLRYRRCVAIVVDGCLTRAAPRAATGTAPPTAHQLRYRPLSPSLRMVARVATLHYMYNRGKIDTRHTCESMGWSPNSFFLPALQRIQKRKPTLVLALCCLRSCWFASTHRPSSHHLISTWSRRTLTHTKPNLRHVYPGRAFPGRA